jgi:peptide/nickel transport system substrate-binding protein
MTIRPVPRSRTGRRSCASVLAAAAVLVLSACGGGSAQGDSGSAGSTSTGRPQSGGTITVNTPTAPSSLDPILGGSGGDHFSLFPIYDRLVNFTKDLKAAPGLAESWDYPDPQTLVLKLRDGVKFQDGTPFDADAVKFNLDRGRTLQGSTVSTDLKPITSVDVTGPHEVTIRLNAADTALPLILADRAGMMVSPTAVQSEGAQFALKPVGAGPFTVANYAPGSKLELTKNSDYWQNGKPYLDGIQITYIADAQTAINSVLGGQTDFATQIPPQYLSSLKNNSSVSVNSAPSLGFDGIYFNFSRAPFDNPDARLAVQMALNPKQLADTLYFGKGEPASQFFPQDYWAYEDKLPHTLYDAAKAKQLAKSSGLTGVTINALGYTAPNQERKLQIIQQQLKAIGVDMTIQMEEVGAGVKDFYTGLKFDMFVSTFSGRPDASLTFASLVSPGSFYNAGHYQPPGENVDALIAAGQKDQDLDARRKAYQPLAKLIQDQALFVPLSFAPVTNVMTAKVHGFEPILTGKNDVSFLWLAK